MPHWEATGLQLECWPPLPEHIARPWDAGDELLAATGESPDLLINDRYGALQCAFPQAAVWADSASAQAAAQRNLQANQCLQSGAVVWQEGDLPAAATLVFIKVPKQFELLQFWLQQCQQRFAPQTRYVLAGMAKHWPVSWLQWLEQHAGSYRQSQVQKKARLVEITLPQPLPAQPLWRGYHSPDQLHFEALPGVFAREQLDIGSRVLLDLPDPGYGGVLCDLGCGNGLLGLTLAHRYRIEQLMLTDDSFLAVRSARHNAAQLGINAEVRHGDGLSAVSETLDWVVCNPPFHDGHRQLTNIAVRMFEESRQRLAKDGKLLVIANRHLPYLPVLNKEFRQVQSLGSDPRFSLYLSRK
ncbi:methyltransferase [Oceanospirillaceae bacterium ASx5O]|nr:methyltransferase [Oceanospirillaceae bacterium ASx5O]